MTRNSTYRLHDDFRKLLPQAIGAAEGKAEVGFPASGRSGLSVGGSQIDLGVRVDVRKAFIDAGVRSGAIQDRAEAERLFSVRFDRDRMAAGTPERAQFDRDQEAARALARGAMERPEVREVVRQAAEKQMSDLAAATARVCGQAGPQARAFCASPRGQLEVATYLHQFGPNDTKTIEAYLRGETVTLGRGAEARKVRIEGELDSDQFRIRYQSSTLWGQTDRKGLQSRHERIDGFLRQNNLDDGSRSRINPGRRSEAPQAEPEPAAQRADSRAPTATEEAREQTTNMASSLAQPTSHRSVWTPDLGKLDEAVASLEADDLPAWTKKLLGRDVLVNGADAAVKGFQRAINASTKPPTFDYRWGLGGRQGRIEVDGDLGPQTRAGLGRAIEKQGQDGFSKLYALDQFGRYVKNVDRGRAKLDDLEDAIGGTLGQAIQDASERAQEALNMFAEDREETGAPLKIDGWIGPKTTEAFGTLLRKTSPERVLARFAGKDFWNDDDLA